MSLENFDSYLAKILSKYKYPEITKHHVNDAIHMYKDLRPDSSLFNDTLQEFACLRGTIPINYKGKCYNIPICIWLLDSYPFNSPLCYVKPTVNMCIRASKHVDSNGRAYLPYLHDWNPDTYGLIGLIQVLIVVFSEQPPVYTKPKSQIPAEPSSRINSAFASIPELVATAIPNPTTTLSNISQNNKPRIITKDYASLYPSVRDKKHLHEVLSELQAEMEVLRKTEEDFNKEKLILEENISCLKIQQSELEKFFYNLKVKEGEMDELSAKVNKQK